MADEQHKSSRIWRGMNRTELDQAYNNSEAVADSQSWLSNWTDRSRVFRSQRPGRLDLRYGERERNTIDIYPCDETDAPLLVFIHGGYWQRNNKEMFACLASGPLDARYNVAMIGYTLCPSISFAGLVQEVATALDWLGANARKVGVFSEKIIVSGWSAGAHLAALMMSRSDISAGLLISGIYDLEPCRLNYLNAALHLTSADVERYSPLRQGGKTRPLVVACGSQELPELQRQSKVYAARHADLGTIFLPLPHHHFSILSELERADGALVDALRELRQDISCGGEQAS